MDFHRRYGAVALLCALVAAPAGSIDPELKPTSDKKFFGKDYPSDNRPAAKTHFEYPYPHFQNDDQFDKDYVKDENGDHGEWNAQMKYDSLRNKLKQQQDEAKAASEREKQAQADFDSAHARYKDAQEKEHKAVELEKKIKGEGTSGTGKAGLPGTAAGVSDAAKHAEDEVSDLEKCKKELAEARKKLKQLMDELEEARAKKAELDKLAGDAEDKEVAAMKVEAVLEKKVDQQDEEHKAALKKYNQKVDEKEKMEKDLAAAEKKLRSIRRGQVDPGGGVYRTGGGGHDTKSRAPASGPTALPSLLAVAALLASWFAAP